MEVALKLAIQKVADVSKLKKIKKYHLKHGHFINGKESRIHKIWNSIIQRCTNINHKNYKDYGGRGIMVCKRWLNKKNGFIHFLEDMGEPPTNKYQIDRINNNKLKNGYSPKNCRWVTSKINNRNRRNNKTYFWEGEWRCLSELAEKSHIKYTTLRQRLSMGWSIERALNEPVR